MSFIKTPIVYKFKNYCKLEKTKFNFKIDSINIEDLSELNLVFQKININMVLKEKDLLYINGNEIKYKDKDKDNVLDGYITKPEWKIKILIQGFKKSTSGKYSPIWKITNAKL